MAGWRFAAVDAVASRNAVPRAALGRTGPSPPSSPSALMLAADGRSTDSDAGIFPSVAARLLDGDGLYADVWDNKDPLFYTFAAALAGGDWRLGLVDAR